MSIPISLIGVRMVGKIGIKKTKDKKWTEEETNYLLELRKKGVSNKRIAEILERTKKSIVSKSTRLIKNNKTKRRRVLDNKEYTFPKTNLTLVGATLYLGDGTKRARFVEFVNTNEETIKIFMNFIRSTNIDEHRLRARVKIHENQNLESCEKYWSEITRIPLKNFTKPIMRTNHSKRKRKLPYGTLTVRYFSKNLINSIKNEIEKIKKSFSNEIPPSLTE